MSDEEFEAMIEQRGRIYDAVLGIGHIKKFEVKMAVGDIDREGDEDER